MATGTLRRRSRTQELPAPETLLDELRRIYDTRQRRGIVEYALRVNANGPPTQLAMLQGEAGNLDEAFRYLDAAIAQHDPALVHLAVAPQWDALRADRRFAERLEAWDLPSPPVVRNGYLRNRHLLPRGGSARAV